MSFADRHVFCYSKGMKYLLNAIIISLFFTACSRAPSVGKRLVPKPIAISQHMGEPKQPAVSEQATPLKKLYAQYNEWRGTPYRYGGLSLKGVDCSGFVYHAYKTVYNISLPRTTDDQVRRGKSVSRAELKTGDLLFFKTGSRMRHVGIYVENGKFIHASTSQGVTISDIKSAYWKKTYWQSRRLAL